MNQATGLTRSFHGKATESRLFMILSTVLACRFYGDSPALVISLSTSILSSAKSDALVSKRFNMIGMMKSPSSEGHVSQMDTASINCGV